MLARAFGASVEASASMILPWFNKATPTRLVEIWEKWAKSVSSIPAKRRSAAVLDLAQEAFAKGLPASWAFVVLAGVAPERTPGHGRAIDIARALMRYSATGHAKKLTLGVWAKLGKLSTYGQKLALQVILPGVSAANPVTPKDVDWEAVSKAFKPLRSPSYRAFLYTEEIQSPEALNEIELKNQKVLENAYPAYYQNMNFWLLKRLSRGESPQALTGNVLTKKEAHIFFSSYTQCTALEFLAIHEMPLESQYEDMRLFRRVHNFWESDEISSDRLVVFRWLRTVLLCPKKRQVLLTPRTINHPVHGELVYSLDSRLDEIQAIDLGDRGVNAPVQAVFEHAAQRVQAERNEVLSQDHNSLCPPWPCALPEGVQHLTTASMLVAEGKRMEHCVGGYHLQVANGQSHIFHVADAIGSATLELDSAGNIRQFYGFRNSTPTGLDLVFKAHQVWEDFKAHLWKSSEWADEVSC
jgi:hypothetical protein